jgi:hypothetical protein
LSFGGGGRAVDADDSRVDTVMASGGAVASIAGFWAVYGPSLLSASPGDTFRPMALAPLLAFFFGYGWWILCLAMGVRQLFVRPRRYGWISVGFGALQFATVPLAMELLMRARGVGWAS